MLDYLIVGLGLAGTCFCETLEKNNRTFKAINDGSQTSSRVAGGLYNPVILKRFTLAWNAKEQLNIAIPFYNALEKKLNEKFDYKIPVLRRFASVEEQNLWFEASDREELSPFLSTEIHTNKNASIHAPFGYGEVLHTGRIDTNKLLLAYQDQLQAKDGLVRETFDYSALRLAENHVHYKSLRAKHVVFAEGFGLKQNPYFNYLPLSGTKGEYITIKAPNLKETNAIKASIFCIPLGNDLYRIGANYERDDKTNTPTEEARTELLQKLNTFLKCDYEVIDQVAGVRPTVVDRRPMVGQHPKHSHLFVLNGFGSRGVLIAPYASQELYQCIEHQKVIDSKIDVVRF